MTNKSRSVLDKIEDAMLKAGPAAGGIFGGLAGAGLLGKRMPVFLAFVIGGAIGGLAVGIPLALLFRLINPKRDRKSKNSPSTKTDP